MNTKLTLTIEKDIIERAKKYASERGTSLSDMVENYFKFLTEQKSISNSTLTPKVKKLRGIIKADENLDYKKIIEEEINTKYNA